MSTRPFYTPEQVEKVRMALAEVGEDPKLVWLWDGVLWSDSSLNHRTVWRAISIARGSDSVCWKCAVEYRNGVVCDGGDARAAFLRVPCKATEPFTEDCGVTGI